MFCEIQLSLKDKIEARGLEKLYRMEGVNRSTRRKNLRAALHPEIKKAHKLPVMPYNIIRREERRKEGMFNRIKKMFRLK